MSERSIRKGDRFRWWNSDRSGFQFGFQPLTSPPNAYYREDGRPVRDNGIMVSPDEYDQPPPSNKPLGGPDIGTGARADSSFANDANVYTIPTQSIPQVTFVNSSNSIQWNRNPVVYIAGSNIAQIMVANPQIQPGTDKLYIALQGVGNPVTISHGSGVSIDFNKPSITLNSGDIATMIYTATDSLWHITSINNNGGLF